jgi:hypothetical protein
MASYQRNVTLRLTIDANSNLPCESIEKFAEDLDTLNENQVLRFSSKSTALEAR